MKPLSMPAALPVATEATYTATTTAHTVKPASSLPMLALIVAIFCLPFALAIGLYFAGWQPTRVIPHGTLIQPPLPLPADALQTADGTPLPTAELHGRWWLLLAGNGPCDTACLHRAAQMRQVHVALNKDMGRLKRLVLTTDVADSGATVLRSMQPDLVVATLDGSWRRVLDAGTGMQIYLIDPQARVMMRYADSADAASIRADLARLLRYSWAG